MTDPPDGRVPVQDAPRGGRPGVGRGVSDLTRVAWVLVGGGVALVLLAVLLVLVLI